MRVLIQFVEQSAVFRNYFKWNPLKSSINNRMGTHNVYNSVFDGKMGCQRTYFSFIYVEGLVYLSQFSTTKSRFQLAKRQLLTIFLLQWSLA